MFFILGLVIGFAAGFLVYRNNKKRFTALEGRLEEAEEKAKRLYDKLSD